MTRVQRLLSRAAMLLLVLAALGAGVLAADVTADTTQAFYEAMAENFRTFQTDFSITYTADRADLTGTQTKPELAYLLRQMATSSPDAADNADFQALNIADGSVWMDDGAFCFHISYMSGQDELDEVDRQAEKIVDGLDLDGEDGYTKIKLIYEYVCTHFTYDHSLTKYTAYEGLTTGSMVCQGYALLTSELLWDAGLPNRVVTGISSDQNHAWNIVELGGKWYYLDTTWDSAQQAGGVMTWDYFLKGTSDFKGHTSFAPYTSQSYLSVHPLAAEGYALPRLSILLSGGAVSSLAVRNGVSVQLVAQLPDGTEAENVKWVSADPDIVSVSQTGVLDSLTTGDTTVTVSMIGDRGVISAQLPTTAVDLKTSSGWAFDDVTDYYLHQLLPISLCSDFQKGVTRGEFARMLYQFVKVTRGWSPVVTSVMFDDIGDSADAYYILMCKSAGLLEGTSESHFSPNLVVTREQAAKALVRLGEYLSGANYPAGSEPAYDDAASISAWAKDSVAVATERGVLQGSGNSFFPQREMTREQMIVAMERLYQSVGAAGQAA